VSTDLEYSARSFNSRVSFLPLLNTLKKNINEGKPGAKKLYGELIDRIEAVPELLQPFSELNFSEPVAEIIEMLLAILFPPSVSEKENLYAVTVPFKLKTIYSSRFFQQLFLKPGGDEVNVPDHDIRCSVNNQKLEFAYRHILAKFFGYQSQEHPAVIYPYLNPETGVTRYLELNLDTRFVDVSPVGDLPPLPDNLISKKTNERIPLEELIDKLPLEKFVFDGLVIIKINDVTEREIETQIKNKLLSIHTFTDASVYDKLQSAMQSLLGMADIKVGITPFLEINDHYVYSSSHNCNSLIFKHAEAAREIDQITKCFRDLLKDYDQPVVFGELDKKNVIEAESLKLYFEMGVRSLILCPLKKNGQLLGLLEIMADTPGKLTAIHSEKIEKVLPLFTLAIEKTMENLDNRIDKVIKENFTAIQPSVEWKFTEAAFSYITGKDEKIRQIAFNDVYPLYGTIDIRSSSVERMQAIQLDLIEQLQMVQRVIKIAMKEIKFPLLESIGFKTDRYIDSITDILLSEDELQVYDFLQNHVAEIFHHLAGAKPSLKKEIDQYFSAIDSQKNLVYHHRQNFEESIAKINDSLASFIDQQQTEAQQVFPHYFERYVTDGVDFNIYIGQSITPTKKFDELYLQNLKIWQLEVLTNAAVIVHRLRNNLTHLLDTTQLILAHSIPISISFRTSERKFDVDGAYNSRYEIVKKRIDKVRIKNSKERLTQPGKIAIVYTLPKEASEYEEYIEFLQTRNLLKPGIEKLELEALQGVIGLKALRVDINYDNTNAGDDFELSSLTSDHLLDNQV
jgi:hypothetical protein